MAVIAVVALSVHSILVAVWVLRWLIWKERWLPNQHEIYDLYILALVALGMH